MSDANVLVRFVRNADDTRAVGALTHLDDDRPDLQIGQVGYVTEKEISLAAFHGIVLEKISPEDAAAQGLEVPELREPEKPLSELSGKELDALAEAEGVDLTGVRKNEDKAEAIQTARDARNNPEGEASLPATATTGTGTPVASPPSPGSGTTSSPGTQTSGGTAT